MDGHTDYKVEMKQPVVQSSDTSAAWTACCNKLSLLCEERETVREGPGRGAEGGQKNQGLWAEEKWKRDLRKERERKGQKEGLACKLF